MGHRGEIVSLTIFSLPNIEQDGASKRRRRGRTKCGRAADRTLWRRKCSIGLVEPKRPLHGAVWCAFLGISPLSCAPSDPSSHWELHIQSSGCRLVPWPYQQGRGRRNPSHNSVHNEVRSRSGVPRWRRSFVIYNILQTAKLGPSKTPHDICPLR